jgi:hypothetical protein
MDVSHVSALSALAGATIGGVTSIATNWLTHHAQGRAQRRADRMALRHQLYGGFIDEASTLYIDALTHEHVDPSKFVQIYATIAKLRLFASPDIVSKADKVMIDILEVYRLPNPDFSKRETASEAALNILQAFSEACRNELRDYG